MLPGPQNSLGRYPTFRPRITLLRMIACEVSWSPSRFRRIDFPTSCQNARVRMLPLQTKNPVQMFSAPPGFLRASCWKKMSTSGNSASRRRIRGWTGPSHWMSTSEKMKNPFSKWASIASRISGIFCETASVQPSVMYSPAAQDWSIVRDTTSKSSCIVPKNQR